MKALAMLAFIAAFAANAADVKVSWTHPTQYSDGTVLALENIKDTRVQYGSCTTATTPTFGTLAVEKYVLAPAALHTFTTVAAGTYCFRAQTTDLQGRISPWSVVVSKPIVEIKPKAPTSVVIG